MKFYLVTVRYIPYLCKEYTEIGPSWMYPKKDPYISGKKVWVSPGHCCRFPKGSEDIIHEEAKAKALFELDWTKTCIYVAPDTAKEGWLSPDGSFYGCKYAQHDLIATIVIGRKVKDLEQSGWLRVFEKHYFSGQDHFRMTAEQRNWLSMRGYWVPDENF